MAGASPGELVAAPRPARNLHVKSGLSAFSPASAFPPRLRWSFFAALDIILMTEEPKTASEIARMIKERAYIVLGPWPVDLQLIIFGTPSGWRCGLSPATQASGDAKYREAVLEIAKELQSSVSLFQPAASEIDKANLPA
jgi:hypothetical protein